MAKGDLKDQLGSFVRGALAQLDTVREVVVQKGKQGRIQIDVALLRRKRRDVLAELGAVVAQLAAEEKITEEVFPEIGRPLAQLQDLDDRIAAEEERARQMGVPVAEGGGGYAGEAHDETYDGSPSAVEEVEGDEDLDSGPKGG
jgi:hypothetical protein